VASSSLAIGLQTSRHLLRRPVLVYGPPGGSLVARCRSTDLPTSLSLPTVGLQTSRRLCRHPLEVMAAFGVLRLPQRFQAFRHIGSIRPSIITTAEGRRFSFFSGASNQPFWTLYCSGATTRVRLMRSSFSYIASTYWKPASTTSLKVYGPTYGPTYGWSCDLSEGHRSSFVLPDPGQVGGSSRLASLLHSDLLDLHS
jgi:hypothetical protein